MAVPQPLKMRLCCSLVSSETIVSCCISCVFGGSFGGNGAEASGTCFSSAGDASGLPLRMFFGS